MIQITYAHQSGNPFCAILQAEKCLLNVSSLMSRILSLDRFLAGSKAWRPLFVDASILMTCATF